jgi:16S rRNA (guanine(1405)-N(7))-methyltransferase
MNEERLEQLLQTVLKSPKYGNVSEDLIRNVGMRELSKQQNLKTAVKATKNKLHQIGGAYFLRKPEYNAWLKRLEEEKRAGNSESFRRICAEIMSYHHSTRARLDILDEFYTEIFSLIPPVHSIIDVACGFHPIAIPWMPLSGRVEYYACDVYRDMMEFLRKFLVMTGVEGCADICDVVQHVPHSKADLAFVLNTLPCLEQIDKSAASRVLESLNSRFLAVSFPVRTLGGREKDMRKHYEARFKKLTEKENWTVQRIEFKSEMVFLVKK